MVKKRRYDIDWLRVFAMLAVFFFHCTRFFDTEDWHLKNSEQSDLLFVSMRGLIWPWVMELFFLLSGVGSWYALKSKTGGVYLRERFIRLLIPLYTVGLIVLLPPQFYFDRFTNWGYRGNLWQIIPRYLAGFDLPSITSSPETLFSIPFSGHLWFLQYLFLISLISLPLFIYLKSGLGQRFIRGLAGWCEGRWGIYLFVIPLALVLIGFRGLFEAQRSWADLFWYLIFFVIGYIIPTDERFTEAIKVHGWVYLAIWLVGFFGGIGLLVLVLGYDPFPGHEPFSWMYVVYQIIWSISSWSAVVFMLSIGSRYMTSKHKVLAYGNEAVLPFYLFHQTIILVVGFYVIRWNLSILSKLLIITAISFSLILGLYELLVRRFNVIRFFFGMRVREKPPLARGPFMDRASS